MSVKFNIFPNHGIVLVQHSGFITVKDALDAMAAYEAHPDAAPGQRHLLDCSGVVDYEKDWVRVLSVQARLTEVIKPDGPETLMVMHAPEGVPRAFAALILKSWQGDDTVLPRIVSTEAEALSLTGTNVKSFAELFTPA